MKEFTLQATPWPAADRLFHSDPRWRGGDDAYSIDLGGGRVLWLFGDSFIADQPGHTRRDSVMVRNSIAVQQGYNPSTATIDFYWGANAGKPVSYFDDGDDTWHWPGHGVLLPAGLLIFLMRVRPGHRTLGIVEFDFEVFGWTAIMIPNPEDDPVDWRLQWLDTPANDFGVVVGAASATIVDDHVYALGAASPGFGQIYLARWRLDQAGDGDLRKPRWWAGEDRGWVEQTRLDVPPVPIFDNGQNELTVHYEPQLKRFLEIQTAGLVSRVRIGFRQAPAITGPWTPLETFYKPQEAERDRVTIYAAKAHPELVGADLVLTYATNHLDVEAVLDDEGLYYPRFLRASIVKD